MFALAFMFAGIALGLLLRKTPIPALASRLLVPITCAMLFALGLAIGANPVIMGSLDSLGLQGLAFAVAGMVGSALVVSLFCRLFPDTGQLPVSHDGAPAKTPENPAAQGNGLEERSWSERSWSERP